MDESLDLLKTTASNLPRDLAYIGLMVGLLFVARFFKDLLTPYKLQEELTTKDNLAVGLSVGGYYLGVLIVCIGPLKTPPPDAILEPVLWKDLLVTGGYVLLGIVLLNLARIIVDKVLLRRFSTVKEIIEDANSGTGAVEGGAYVASGLVVAAALSGRGGGPHTTIAFVLLGMLGLVAYGHIYMLVCRYDVHDEIEKDNVAAGVALGLNLVAIGVILVGAIAGDFRSWTYDLTRFAAFWVLGTILLLVLRFLVDFALLPGARMDKEIKEDRNLNAAWIEGAVLSGIAVLLVTIL
ncbi:MAG: DUF350 domain-containing protein [Polyangiaceae bacterium]